MFTNKVIKRAVRYALLTGAAAAVAMPANAADEQIIQEVVVTGSLIPLDLNAPGVPVTVMTSEDIQLSGAPTDVLDVLKKTQPAFFGGLNIGSENGNVSSNSTNGGSMVSLRNRPTLVLINGRRAATSPVAASGGFAFVDVSLIPTAAIDRVEILADGASATYGADAVGGVVNLILKSHFDGVEVGGRYGFDKGGDYTQRSYYATMGTSNDTTSVTFSANYQRNDPLLQWDRSWSRGQYRTPSYAGIVNIGNDYYYLNPDLNAPPTGLNLTPEQLVAQGIYQGPMSQGGATQFFDLARTPTMLIASERKSAVLSMEHDIAEHHTLFGDVLLANSKTHSQLNAQPVSGFVDATPTGGAPDYNPFADVYAINPDNNQLELVNLTARNRFIAFPRVYDNDTTAWRGVIGVRGDIVGSWKYEVAANWNQTTSNFRNGGLIDTIAYNAAVLDGSYNPFARDQQPGVLESFQGRSAEDYRSALYMYDARVFGELFDLPAGAVQLAIGVSTMREKLSYNADRNTTNGGWLQATPTQAFNAKQDNDAVYAELRVPVFSDANAIPGFHALELSLAARKVHYEKIDDNPTVPKFTLRWQPFGDSFAIRGSYSESFTAPTLYELYGPTGSGFTSSQQIHRYDTSGNSLNTLTDFNQYMLRSGANADLEPSKADTFSFGVDWRPDGALSGFTASLDYYKIKEKDIVDTLPSNDVLNHVEQFGPASPFAQYVRLGAAAAGQLLFDDGAPITTPGQITNRPSDSVWLSLLNINLASITQDGLDLKVGYTHDTDSIGTFSGQVSAAYLLSYKVDNIPGLLPIEDLSGVYNDDYGLFPKWRGYLNLGWALGAFSANVNGTFIPSVDDVTFGAPFGNVKSYNSWDLRLSYDFSDLGPGVRASVGVNNFTNEDPPFIDSEANQQRDINSYDPLGRFYFMELSYKF
ncbi:MAG TPA: TonB-dependent receptor [Povalibacter sp.]|nr:TonB-dependent receptor [Povalibacter sp.]